jgi:cell shape-determining protein MreC
MTTISSNRKRRIGPGAFIFLAIFLVCMTGSIVLRAQAGSIFWEVISPLVQFRNALGGTEASVLRAELASTTAALADRNALYQENLQLKELLGRSIQNHTVLGAVLQRPPGMPYDTLIIDIGKNSGVMPGDLVFAGGSSVIGTVSDVYDTTSRVVLFSAPGETYQSLLGGSIPLSLSGQGAGSMSGEVPAGTPATVGESVTLSGIASAFAGSVSYIHEDSGASFETLYVQLPADVFSLHYVEVQINHE